MATWQTDNLIKWILKQEQPVLRRKLFRHLNASAREVYWQAVASGFLTEIGHGTKASPRIVLVAGMMSPSYLIDNIPASAWLRFTARHKEASIRVLAAFLNGE